MTKLLYPFDPEFLLRKSKSLLKATPPSSITKRIAILGGSTTANIRDMLELFLANNGIKASFYESEYGQYWSDAMFGSDLKEFNPDVIFIHTGFRNITELPELTDTPNCIELKLNKQFQHFQSMWDKLKTDFNVPIIQNNFERPIWRLMGNRDVWDLHGTTNFVSRLNQKLYEFAQNHKDFYINDIDYLSAQFGLDKWHDSYYWYMFKYICAVPAIPHLSFSVANIIKSIYGKNKKALVLDLDNTLWGGIIGDDGVEGIALGPEVSMGQAYTEFQQYIAQHKNLGIILTVASKNEHENAIAGLEHPDGALKPADFAVIKANWNNKDQNIRKIADTLNIGLDSFVFIDDNPAERAIVSENIPDVSVVEITDKVEDYIRIIDNNGFFETTNFTNDDLHKSKMYAENAQRTQAQESYENYHDFLLSLNMKGLIRPFEPIYYERIAQLTNKSNQFNLTTQRYSLSDIEQVAKSKEHLAIYGKLSDKFGDNGLVSVVIGKKLYDTLKIELWLMSCRVLKRQMENAMLDALVRKAQELKITKLHGTYLPTPKNKMVCDFYQLMGFTKTHEETDGATEWELDITNYKNTNTVIEVEE